MKSILPLIILGLAAFGLARAADHSSEARELQQRRAAVEARFLSESRACQDRFQVNACVDKARAERVAALKPIFAREQVLDAEDRKARSEAQANRVAERQREFAAEEGKRRTQALSADPAPARSSGGGIGTLLPANPSAAHAPPVDPEAHARAITRQADEAAAVAARERQQLNQRQRLVLQHQQDFQRRQEEKESSDRKPGKPLPIPTAAEIAAAAASAVPAASSARR